MIEDFEQGKCPGCKRRIVDLQPGTSARLTCPRCRTVVIVTLPPKGITMQEPRDMMLATG